jgi:hypothetical protein
MIRALTLRLFTWINPWNTKRRLQRWHERNQKLVIPAAIAFQEALSEAQQAQTNLRIHGKNYSKLRKECFDCGVPEAKREEAIRACDDLATTIDRIRRSYTGIDLESETGVIQAALRLFPRKLLLKAPMAVNRYAPGISELMDKLWKGTEY